MQEPDPPITLGLSKPSAEPLPAAEELQFRRAERVSNDAPAVRTCVACKQPVMGNYFHAQGQVVCPLCADRIQSGQQAPPSTSILRAVLYGAGAALAGCALYAMVAIVTGLEIGFIAIVVGIMVGKAVRHASYGRGGRPQQILAVALTYFAITTSYIPVFIYQGSKPQETKVQDQSKRPAPAQAEPSNEAPMSPGGAIVYILGLALAAPFLGLFSGGNPVSGLISLFIIFIGLRQAWALTARPQILMTGPHAP